MAITPVILAWPFIQSIRGGVLAGGLLTITLAWWAAYKPLLEAVRKKLTLDFSGFWKKSEYKAHIAFLDKFRDEFGKVVSSLPANNQVRLVAFIDDLDR